MLISSNHSITKYKFNDKKIRSKILFLPILTTESNKLLTKNNISNSNNKNNSINESNKKNLSSKYDKYILKFHNNTNDENKKNNESDIKKNNNNKKINLKKNKIILSYENQNKFKSNFNLNNLYNSNLTQLKINNQLKLNSKREKISEKLNKNFDINQNQIKNVNLNKYISIPEKKKNFSLIQKELMIRYLKKNMFKEKVSDKYISVLGEIVDYDNLIPEKIKKKNLLLQFSKYKNNIINN